MRYAIKWVLKRLACEYLGCRETVVETLPLSGLEKTVCSRCGTSGIRGVKEAGIQPSTTWPRK